MHISLNHVQKQQFDFINNDTIYDYYQSPVEILDDKNKGHHVALVSGKKDVPS